jgi:GNAT superfamily N-acetyltransferase
MVEVRAATADDHDAYAALFPELGVDDPVPSRSRFVDEVVPRALVATEGGAVVGYATYEVLAELGYVRNLVTDPAHRRRGVGGALMEELRRRFAGAGATAWCLNVKPDNASAIALYERCGMRRAYLAQALRLPASVPLAPPPADLRLDPVEPDEDEAVEAALAVPRGQLASARARTSRQVLQLRRGQALLGVAVFSAHIPGAFPFRVVDPALGPALLAHLRPLAPPGAPHVQVVVEDAPALRDVLLALGARMHMETAHMNGPLR